MYRGAVRRWNGTGEFISFTETTSGKPILIHDCWFWGNETTRQGFITTTFGRKGVFQMRMELIHGVSIYSGQSNDSC